MSFHEIAILFPGQGVVDLAAARSALTDSPEALLLLAEVEDSVRPFGHPAVARALASGPRPGPVLDLMIFTASLAAYRRLESQGVAARALVGHGFGEIAALVAAGALSVGAGAEIVASRATALASLKHRRAMAKLKISPSNLKTFLRILNVADVALGVENSSKESVIVGPPAGIAAAEDLARLFGIGFQRLKSVAGPHHSDLQAARDALGRSLAHIARRPASVPVYSPLLGRFYRDDDDLLACIAEQLTVPLRFAAAVAQLAAEGVTLFVECGPVKGLVAGLDCTAVSDVAFAARLVSSRSVA